MHCTNTFPTKYTHLKTIIYAYITSRKKIKHYTYTIQGFLYLYNYAHKKL